MMSHRWIFVAHLVGPGRGIYQPIMEIAQENIRSDFLLFCAKNTLPLDAAAASASPFRR